MTKPNPSRSFLWFSGAAIAILCAGTVAAWLSLQSLQSRSPQALTPQRSSSSQTNSHNTLATEGLAEIYWLSVENNETKWIATPVTGTKSLDKNLLLKTTLEQLLTQTPAAPLTSAIPIGTRLLSVKTTDQGVYIDLSQAFTEGGGSESMRGRLGQLIYTATSLDHRASVWISVEGKPLETLGGEGLMISQPINRQLFDDNF